MSTIHIIAKAFLYRDSQYYLGSFFPVSTCMLKAKRNSILIVFYFSLSPSFFYLILFEDSVKGVGRTLSMAGGRGILNEIYQKVLFALISSLTLYVGKI